MSCCNFSGTDNKGYNLDPKTERVVEAIYSDWTEAAGGPSFPVGGPGTFKTGGSGEDCCDNPDLCGSGQTCNGCQCMTTTRSSAGDPWNIQPNDWGKMGRPMVPKPLTTYKNADPWNITKEDWGRAGQRAGDPRPVTPQDLRFDGAAVKQNWIPLVVLGLSLVVGIGISEWATKKYIK